jgi:hypothetical protein
MSRMHVGIVSLGGTDELVIRPYLESLGCLVTTYRIGRPNDLVAVLSGAERYREIEHLFLDCHGGEQGFSMPELAPEVVLSGEPVEPWGPEQVRKFARLSGLTVLSGGCYTGSPALGSAFLDAGASAYLAPDDAVEGHDGLAFELRFYFELVCRGLALEAAYAAALSVGGEAFMYRLYR